MALSLNDNGAVYQDPSGNGDFTDISFFGWIKLSAVDRNHRIFMNGHTGSFGQGFQFFVHNTTNTLRIDVAFVASINSTFEITDTDWHFVGFQRRASDSKWLIYLDSTTPQELGTNGPFSNDANAGMVIGGRMVDGTITPGFAGLQARTGYWDRLLTATEIGELLDGSKDPGDLTTNLLFHLDYPDGNLGNNDGGSLGDFSLNGTTTFSSDDPFGAAANIRRYSLTTLGVG